MRRNQFMNVASRYIPANSVKISDKLSDAIAYAYEKKGQFVCIVYYGKQSKPVIHYRYSKPESREKAIREAFEGRRASLNYTKELREKRKAYVNSYKVGDIVNTCWGYDQTNREFYEVVGVNKKHVTMRQIAVKGYGTGFMSENVAPLPGSFIGEPFTRLAQEKGIKIGEHSFTFATLSDFSEPVAGLKVYKAQGVSHYA
jgi:hypothetical protein